MIKKMLIGLGLIICIGTAGFTLYKLPFVLGHWQNKVDLEIGLESKNVQREKFKNNQTYIEGKTNDLQRYKRELERTEDKTSRQAIIINIQDEFSDFDETKMENSNLRQFLKDIRNGNIN